VDLFPHTLHCELVLILQRVDLPEQKDKAKEKEKGKEKDEEGNDETEETTVLYSETK